MTPSRDDPGRTIRRAPATTEPPAGPGDGEPRTSVPRRATGDRIGGGTHPTTTPEDAAPPVAAPAPGTSQAREARKVPGEGNARTPGTSPETTAPTGTDSGTDAGATARIPAFSGAPSADHPAPAIRRAAERTEPPTGLATPKERPAPDRAPLPDAPAGRPVESVARPAPSPPAPPPEAPAESPESTRSRRRPGAEPEAPRIHVGQVEVVVQAPREPRPAPKPASRGTTGLASRLYLKGL
ncbi:MAG: hypothetical protein PVG07_16720 [Acidobacteriota bacterium]